MAEMEFRFDLEKGENEIQQLKLRESRFTMMGGAILSVVAVGFLLFIVLMRGANNKNLKLKNLAIRQQNQKLEESNEVLRQFAYASAHDLKEPLRNIGSFVSLLQRRFTKDLPEEAQEYMGFVTTGVRRMNSLLEDLLEYSTLITDKQPEKEMIDLKDIVTIVSSNLQNTIESKHAEIRLGDKLPQIEMNRLHLTQLFQNLISNSLKFVHDKPPLVLINGQSKNGEVTISVKDNGIGIKQEYSAKVFQLFHRLNKTNQQFEGTGIGLTICKNIVEKYNGRIWFESDEANGTTFFIAFPDTKAA
jgi:light-regulated signal transduction histidine kinase (bacteriophytochrome)